MQAFLQRQLLRVASQECREGIQSFFLLCDVLDALQLCATGRVDADALEEKLCRHLRKYVEVYGPDKVLPKGHYALHLADSLREHEILLSCFVHERRHRSVKQIADQLDSMKAGSEEHVVQVVVENHLKNLRTYSVGRKGLVTPRSAAAPLQQAFCPLLWLGRMPWLGKLQRSGRGTRPHLQARGCSGGHCRRYADRCTSMAACVFLRPCLHMPVRVVELGEQHVPNGQQQANLCAYK